jgi:hypothetical protein
VVPQGLQRAAVIAGSGPASASYDVDAATTHMEQTWNNMNAASTPYDPVLARQARRM